MAKKNEVLRRHVEEVKQEPYVIPQIPDDSVGLRNLNEEFKPTAAVSPMEGPYTKDVLTIPDVEIKQDILVAYDPFRVEKKLTEEDELTKYGRKYHEFDSVDAELDPNNYVKKPDANEKKSGGVGLNFGVVQEANEVVSKPEVKPTTSSNPYIRYNTEPVKPQEVVDVSFNPVNISNEIKEEQQDYIAKPISRVEFPQVNQVKVDESIPKTIVMGKSFEAFSEDTPKINVSGFASGFNTPITDVTPSIKIPPFMSQGSSISNSETEIEFDTPRVEVKHESETTVYDKYKAQPEEKTVIYSDKYANYKFPSYALLNPVSETVKDEPEWIYEKIDIINQTLSEFGIDGEVVAHTYGPTVTRYEVKLNSGVNVKKINSISDNIKMNLSAKTIRIEAPIPGKSNVGIEVPNNVVRLVSYAEIINNDQFKYSTKPLNVALGLNIDGEPVYTSIAKMPHGLVAGGTGSGKSVCVNGLLISLLFKYSPEDLKLILVDPKKVELTFYEDLPHLATPVIKEPKLASEVLKWACDEMDRRYRAFSAAKARDLEGFNAKIANDPSMKKTPYLVIVIDELYDLMLTCGNDVEASIQRITQMGRAAGIHLIVATQRPTTDVIKGTIKANIPCRIAFKVSQYVDSATILDQGGAEMLLGRGDMLFKTDDLPIRIQGAYISEDEISRVCDFIRDNYPTDYIFTHEDLQNTVKQQYGANSKETEDMKLVYDVALYVLERGTCSINSIQTSFCLGFRRAQRIVEILEEMGVVSGSKGTTGREILMTLEDVNQIFKMGE